MNTAMTFARENLWPASYAKVPETSVLAQRSEPCWLSKHIFRDPWQVPVACIATGGAGLAGYGFFAYSADHSVPMAILASVVACVAIVLFATCVHCGAFGQRQEGKGFKLIDLRGAKAWGTRKSHGKKEKVTEQTERGLRAVGKGQRAQQQAEKDYQTAMEKATALNTQLSDVQQRI